MDAFSVSKVLRRNAVDDVREQLVALIESEQIKVDERLPSEIELARQFGVSRPVVREALVGLSALGLTSSQPGRGTFVASNRVRTPMLMGRFSPAHLNEVRRHLEVPSARLAAERRSDAQVGQLAAIIARMEDSDDPTKRNKLDADFHVAIAAASGNPLLVKLIEDLRTLLEEHSLAASAMPARRSGAINEHREVYEAILRQEPDKAAAAMAGHLDAVDNSFVALARDHASPIAAKD